MQRLSEVALGVLMISEEVVASIATHGREVAARLVELWTALGQDPPDVEGNFSALQGGLEASGQRVAEADRRHVRQLAVTTGLRQKVRQVTHRIYHKFSTIRRLLDEVHGEGKAFVLATIEGPTARTARRLLRQCELALAQLLDPSVELPTHELDGIELNPLKLALGLRPDVDLLRSLLADLRRERRVLQKTRKEKNQAVEDHRRTLVWTARTVEGYYMLAGEVELAERLRPATRRKSSPQTEGEDQTPPQGGTPEETSPPDESPLPEASETAPSPTDA